MNYYEHHIGDYAEATAHLSFVEDAAYSRCIRKYYANEKPLPADMKAVQRLVGARTKEERQAIEAVLKEFFELRSDGWHNRRCDEEIESYQARAPDREAKKANEEHRLQRHREERARLFEELRALGVHCDWNEKIGVLRDKIQQEMRKPATAPATTVTLTATAPATPATASMNATATASQSPVPSPHTPIFDSEAARRTCNGAETGPETDLGEGDQRRLQPPWPFTDDDLPPNFEPGPNATPEAEMACALRKAGVRVTVMDPEIGQWLADRFTTAQMLEFVSIARISKPEGAIPARYLDRVARDKRDKPARAAQPAGKLVTHQDREQRDLQALKDRREQVGLAGFRDPEPGESVTSYRLAQDAEWTRRKSAPVPDLAKLAASALPKANTGP